MKYLITINSCSVWHMEFTNICHTVNFLVGVKHKFYNVIDVNLVLILHLYSACKMYKIAHTCMHLQMFIATLTSVYVTGSKGCYYFDCQSSYFFFTKKATYQNLVFKWKWDDIVFRPNSPKGLSIWFLWFTTCFW